MARAAAKAKPDGIKLVIVESPTKARTIRRFLGKGYLVESCMGHVRDLPQSAKDIPEKYKKESWAALGVNVENSFEPIYCIPRSKTKVVSALKESLKEASELYLATDEDREGESISWHLMQVLKPKVPVSRLVFHEITPEAVDKALNQLREMNLHLVKAQEARRILDRLVGYTLSPLLWKKIAYGLSAGRVQSAALRLVVERERERLRFHKAKYADLIAHVEEIDVPFESRMVEWQGKKVATGRDFDPETGALKDENKVIALNVENARDIADSLRSEKFEIAQVEEKPLVRRPPPPFITSTLQQESNRKLGLGSRETMGLAQRLYEQGFITYMRTDSTFLSNEALLATRDSIERKYGSEYLPESPRSFAAKKVKGAQEAHEAIRPSGRSFLDPDQVPLSGNEWKLYELIWKRTMASQMQEAQLKQVSLKLNLGEARFQVSGTTVEFPGFLRAYVEGSDDPDGDLGSRDVKLPAVKVGQVLPVARYESRGHETKPPHRFTEASLVHILEKEGIGRPSTYATIISTIQDRGYVSKQGNQLQPTFTAFAVAQLLSEYLPKYVDMNFTSSMEKSLDEIAEGDLDPEAYLDSIYWGDEGLKQEVDAKAKVIDPDSARSVKVDGFDQYQFRVGRYGAYVVGEVEGKEISASVPDEQAPASITADMVQSWLIQKMNGADSMGEDPETGKPVYVLNGRYGPYVQLGGNEDTPKRVSIPKQIDPLTVDLKVALQLLELPKTLGQDPESGHDVKVGIGRFGPYVYRNQEYRSVPKDETVFTMTLERAIELLNTPKSGRGRRAQALKDLGVHPDTEKPVQIFSGPYGLYVKCGTINAPLASGQKPEEVSLEQALELLAERKKAKSKARGEKKRRAG